MLQPGLEVTYLYNDSIIDWQDPPCLSLSNPCFIRLAMFIGEDPIFYSNPIIFTGQVPNPITSLCSVDYIPKTKVDNAEYLLFPTIISTEFTLSITAKEACKYKISIIDNEGKYIKYLGEFKVKSGENIKNISNLKLAQGNYFLLMETEFVNKTLSFFVTK